VPFSVTQGAGAKKEESLHDIILPYRRLALCLLLAFASGAALSGLFSIGGDLSTLENLIRDTLANSEA
jgi:hypothetical protein